MEKKSLILVPALLIAVIGIMAMVTDEATKPSVDIKNATYTFEINDYKMVRSAHRTERNNEKAFLLDKMLNDMSEVAQFPLTQSSGQPYIDKAGKHIAPRQKTDLIPRVDLVHSKGEVKDFYKLKMNPTIDAKPSTVVCVPRAGKLPEGNFKYKFTTKAENTVFGTMPYTCYVTPDNEKIKNLLETLPGIVDAKGMKTMGQQ